MSNLSVFDFNSNNIRFENREGRVWVCLTDMAKASGKRINDWNRLNATSEFLTEFESIAGIPVILSNVGNLAESERGTWAIDFSAL
jgi:prophage antirepressor-like protein